MKNIIGAILLLVCGTASAIPVTWTLDSVVFDDGGTATGSFVYDAETNSYSNISIVLSAGTNFAGATMTHCFSALCNDDPFDDTDDGIRVGFATAANLGPSEPWGSNTALELQFEAPGLTNAGGTVDLACNTYPGQAKVCGEINADTLRVRRYISGQVSAIPVPAAVWLFGSGLGLLGWMRRK